MAHNGAPTSEVDAVWTAGQAQAVVFGVTEADLEQHAEGTPLSREAVQNAADVVLVCGCLKRATAALADLDRTLRAGVPLFIRRIDRDSSFADEVCQALREKLLHPERPRLRAYNGAGSLFNWLRVAAVRQAIDMKRADAPLSRLFAESVSHHLVTDGTSPDLAVLRARYGQALVDAISRGLRKLPRRHRAILRLYLLGGVNIEELGRMYRVHRSTIARWISTAERSVFDGVKSEFRERWGIATNDMVSLARVIRSQLPLSLEDAL
jgi:RNA polymerase sigma-70 factor (ECF subfamily)